MPCRQGFLLRNCGKKGRKVVDRVDIVLLHHLGKSFCVKHIRDCARTAFKDEILGLRSRDVACNDIPVGNHLPEFHRKFRPDLSGGTNN